MKKPEQQSFSENTRQTSEEVLVLHVDDEPDQTALAKEVLESQNDEITVLTEPAGRDALKTLAREPIDCIVSDYQMPKMNGLELLDEVRDSYPHLPFILYTRQGSEEIASEAIGEGATDYLQKQVGHEQYELLANRVTNAVEEYRAKQRASNLDRIRRILRDANQALVRARTRDEVERRVCEIINDAEPYTFAWIGEVDPNDQGVKPRTAAGKEDGYLENIEITIDERQAGRGPIVKSIRTRELVAEQNIPKSGEYEPWREDALERGYQSSAAVPIVYNDILYGVLNVYADRTNVFDKDERDFLTQLADDIAHAIDRLEVLVRQERLERVIDAVPVGVYRATPGRDGEIVYANPALANIVEADSTESLVGRQVRDLYQYPDQRKDISDQILQRGLLNGEELRLETFEGDEITAEVTAIKFEQNGKVEFGGIVKDITERKNYEQKLQIFKAAIEAAGHSIYFTDTNGCIKYVNPAFEETTGYTADEAVGLTPRILKSGDHDPEFYEELWDTILNGEIWQNELVNTAKSGDEYVIDQTIAPVKGDGEEITHFVAVNLDITERKEYEQELQRENERLDEFASVISHDLRNPLNIAYGHMRLLKQDIESDHIDKIAESLDRMDEIIESTLTLARKGKIVGDMEPVRCQVLAENCWEMVETGEATLEITDWFTIQADSSRLKILCENLFRNAFEHGPEDVAVRVGQIDERGFYIEDDGPGISNEKSSQVFEAGYSTDEQGAGLGLTIAKQVVEAHGWELSVTESKAGGARFEITGVEFSDI